MTVCVKTENPLLADAIRALLPEEEFFFTDGEAELTLLDADTLPLAVADMGQTLVLCSHDISLPRTAHLLRVPFDLYTFADTCRAALSTTALTPLEGRLLALLQEAEGKPVSRDALMQALWGDDGTEDKLNLYIHYLRKKLEADGVRRIFACRGRGYYYQCRD